MCLLLVVLPVIAYGQEYSLDELFVLSLEKSETVKISEEDLSIADHVIREGRALVIAANKWDQVQDRKSAM